MSLFEIDASAFEAAGRVSEAIISALAKADVLGCLSQEAPYYRRYFEQSQELGKLCQSTRTLLTVHGMASHALLRWGESSMQEAWLPRLSSGQALSAVAFSEPHAGSDLSAVQCKAARSQDGHYRLSGEKRWVSFGQRADAYLLLATVDGQPSCFWLPKETPGLEVTPSKPLLGLRASLTADLSLDECSLPEENLVGQIGWGLNLVAQEALTLGRLSVALGCVGGCQALLDESYRGSKRDHQLVRRLLSRMRTQTAAAHALCRVAMKSHLEGSNDAPGQAMMAKYFSAESYQQAAHDAVQLQGARGCVSGESKAELHYRDSKIMGIIEGSQEVLEDQISQFPWENQA